jgi:hypothetical protein
MSGTLASEFIKLEVESEILVDDLWQRCLAQMFRLKEVKASRVEVTSDTFSSSLDLKSYKVAVN